MNTKKSKFQERLDAAAKKYLPEEDRGSVNDQVKLHDTNLFDGNPQKKTRRSSQTAQPPESLHSLSWKSVKKAKPLYYQPIYVWDGKKILPNWTRVNDGEHDFYVNNVTNDVKTDVTHWSYPYGSNIPDADPMTANDLPGHDLREIIKAMEKLKTYYSKTFIDPTQFIEGIESCIEIVQKRLKKITKPQQLKLHSRNTRT